ncbi:methyltransferase domain-containing protein [Kocuria rhizophila]|uniref:Methyltransferase domain-containing protein n=1 Tax=Kocuria rhizophila TaxID=72000 RepID=A0AAX2SAX7_KOCRH|nr:methyltransferase [Kocuria rhizophila]WIW69251.1 methyltransferase [Kocuria sp. ChxB]MCT1545025.1 methyltransferase [Kocuria rhizophila]MCT2170682.1 methyltransferase [Kocuria rhizophila]MDA4828041.1 methyltransferase [Kocuria rhizophila]TFH99526.1 methyltransferase domain-containing protein [Kocuria rhizophila]
MAQAASGPARFSTVPDAPRSDDAALVAALRADLAAAGFTVDRVTDLVGPEAMSAWSRDQAVPARRALRERGSQDPALSALTAFFLLGDPVRSSALDAALPTVGAAGLVRLGLVEGTSEPTSTGGGTGADSGAGTGAGADPLLSAAMDLRPYATDSSEELWVASDLGAFQRPGVLRHDHVLGIGGASTTLVQSTPRRPVATALDLGTGCGIQTFHLLAHAEHVTATDISERALATTRFNLVLNAPALGLDPEHLENRVRLELGSMLEPVAGQHFDMVVSNPPFVITPRTPQETDTERFTYRDGGLPGDRIVRDLLAELPSVLAPGGTAHLLANWEIPRDPQGEPESTWSRGPESWIPTGTGAWVIQRELQDPCEYAETWLQDASQQRDPQAFDRAYAAYLDDFASRDVAAIGFGMVWLQRPEDTERTVSGTVEPGRAASSSLPRIFETVPHPIQQPIAPALAAEWERTVRLGREAADAQSGAAGQPAWLERRLTVAPDVTEERHGTPGAEDPSLILLRQGAGLRRTVILSSEAAGFAGVCDGELSAQQILTALGVLLGWEEGPSEQLVAEIAGLIAHGFLLEVSD